MSMFPGAGAHVHRNAEGEPLGWDYPSDDASLWCDDCGLSHTGDCQLDDETFADPCDRCGDPIPSNHDRSPNYCKPCAVIVNAQGGDED